MDMKKTGINWTIGAAVLLSVLLQATAPAGELGLWPDMFRDDALPVNGDNTSLLVLKNPDSVTVLETYVPKTFWQGWMEVKLPVGTKINSVVYYHGGGGNHTGRNTRATLYRVKLGEEGQIVSQGVSYLATPETVTMHEQYPGRLKIKEGYRYYFYLTATEGTKVRGAKITY
jgi:hypothetical protein